MTTRSTAYTVTLTYLTGRAMADLDIPRTAVVILLLVVALDWLHDPQRPRRHRFGKLPGPLLDPRHSNNDLTPRSHDG